jgi:hypothetical protein
MNISPLLPATLVEHIMSLLASEDDLQRIQLQLDPLPLEERVHVLRFLARRASLSNQGEQYLVAVWRKLLLESHPLDSPDLRLALVQVCRGWDIWGEPPLPRTKLDELETLLEQIGRTQEGTSYFEWVALHPHYPRMDNLFEEERRGALTALARYGFIRPNRSSEFFIARHLDDSPNVQDDVLHILEVMKSRVLARLAPWYMRYDEALKPTLIEHQFVQFE